MGDVAFVLVLGAGCELGHAHVHNALLAEFLAPVQFIKQVLFLISCDNARARRSLIHLDLLSGLLALSFLLLAILA